MGVFFFFLLYGPQVEPFFLLLLFLFITCRMGRGYEEVSTNQVGRRRGTPREMPIASNLVVAMSTEELRLYNQIFVEISLEMSDGAATSTVGEAGNVIYFTRE